MRNADSERTPAQTAQLAMLLEVSTTPAPGNVDRHREYDDLRFEHFLAGAVGALPGLERGANGDAIGDAFETAVRGMANQSGGNTQFGSLLLLVPLVQTAAVGSLEQSMLERRLAETTVADAAAFYRSFDIVDVAVDEPPSGADALDVRRGADAIPTLEDRQLSLFDIMDLAGSHDDVAREWVEGYPRSFEAAHSLAAGSGTILERAAETFIELLAARPDTFVAINHDEATAAWVSERAQTIKEHDGGAIEAFAEELIERGINPGTTADILSAGLFIGLQRGDLEV